MARNNEFFFKKIILIILNDFPTFYSRQSLQTLDNTTTFNYVIFGLRDLTILYLEMI